MFVPISPRSPELAQLAGSIEASEGFSIHGYLTPPKELHLGRRIMFLAHSGSSPYQGTTLIFTCRY